MRKALYFDRPEEFCDFVRLQGTSAFPHTGELFEIHHVVNPHHPGRRALLILNFRSKLTDRFKKGADSVKVEVKEGIINCESFPAPLPIVETRFVRSLVECVEIVKWKADNSTAVIRGSIYFVVKDEDAVAELIGESLQLGNDRIQFGPLCDSAGNKRTLLKVENPSYYIIQKCLEDLVGKVDIYYQQAPGLFLPWGFEHPLQEWWDRSEKKQDETWIFFSGGIDFFHVEPVIWQDAYDLADLSLDFSHLKVFGESPETPPRFDVKMRITHRATSSEEPELWLLDDAGLKQLENTLQLTDDVAMRAWQIAIQKWEGQSRDWVFIREIRSRSARSRHHDFGGTAFARYRGINDLLLPVGYELQPPLRRDAYRHLFDLEAGFMTVLVPESIFDSKQDGFLVLKLSERAFENLSTYIDYIVERDAVELENLMSQSVFDFKHYLKAPKHPGLTSGTESSDGNRGKSVKGIGSLDSPEVIKSGEVEKSDGTSLMDRLNRPTTDIDEELLGALEKDELRLERDLINDGQSVEIWSELLVCKNQLGKTADAIVCAIEGLWLAKGMSREPSLLESLISLVKTSLEVEPQTVTTDDMEWVRRAAIFSMVMTEPDPHSINQWVSENTSFLKEHESGLRLKEKWLAWGRVLEHNKDLRQETRLREELRNRITEQGLSLEDTPAFLRSRIFLDRKIGAENEDGQAAVESAIVNLSSLQVVVDQFKSDRLTLAGKAILARAYSRIGDVERAQRLLSDESRSKDACGIAWEAMFRIEALRGIDQSRADAIEAKLDSLLAQADKDTAQAISDLRNLYVERGDDDNPAAFLARENRGRTYPRGPGSESGVLYELSKSLEEYVNTGNEAGAVMVMNSMMSLEDKAQYDDHVKFPQFVETLVGGLERFKWGERGAALIPTFESFTDRAGDFVTTPHNHFYGSILHSNLALGLLVVENVEKSVNQISKAEKLVTDSGISDLDFIDAGAALLKTVEQLPLNFRGSVLSSMMQTFRDRFDLQSTPYLSNERLFSALVKLLDQMAEAASSKDKLSLQQFRSYQLQDEFFILERIQTETFTE